jgi:hypothetical protein
MGGSITRRRPTTWSRSSKARPWCGASTCGIGAPGDCAPAGMTRARSSERRKEEDRFTRRPVLALAPLLTGVGL